MRLLPCPRRSLVLALALFSVAHAALADVLVVDAAGGGSLASIQAAVDAAQEGDTILVRDGDYDSFTIIGRSLSVVADGDAVRVERSSSIYAAEIHDLASGQQVLVRGLVSPFGFGAFHCEGAVWFDDCTKEASSSSYGNAAAGATVRECGAVTFTACALTGTTDFGGFDPPVPIPGVLAVRSTVQIYDTTIEGARGARPFYFHPPQPGGAGLVVRSSTVTVVGCAIVGGGGAIATPPYGGSICTTAHPPGGPGVRFVGGSPELRSAASTAVGGATSLEPLCPGATGPAGPAITGSGTITALPGYARGLRAGGPVRGGGAVTFELTGLAGEVPVLVSSLVHAPIAAGNGCLLVGMPPADVIVLPALPTGGRATFTLPVSPLGAPVGLTVYVQAAYLDPAPAVWLGAATSVVLVGT